MSHWMIEDICSFVTATWNRWGSVQSSVHWSFMMFSYLTSSWAIDLIDSSSNTGQSWLPIEDMVNDYLAKCDELCHIKLWWVQSFIISRGLFALQLFSPVESKSWMAQNSNAGLMVVMQAREAGQERSDANLKEVHWNSLTDTALPLSSPCHW